MEKQLNQRLQKVFVIMSVLVLVVLVVFYGARTVEYAKEAARQTLAKQVKSQTIVTEGEGLYQYDDTYLFRGSEVDNYVRYQGILWRIVEIDEDDNIILISDEAVTQLPFNSEMTNFSASELAGWLNEDFKELTGIESSGVTVYNDEFSDLSYLDNRVSESVEIGLLDVVSYINSIVDGKSFVSGENEKVWLSDQKSETVYYAIDGKVSSCSPDEILLVKPVISLSGDTLAVSGQGTYGDPYNLDEDREEIQIGDSVILDDTVWLVTEVSDCIKLVAQDPVASGAFASTRQVYFDLTNEDSLAYYLNNDYLNSLSYKDLLVETSWNTGEYDGTIASIGSESVSCYVSLPSLTDLQLTSAADYWLSNSSDYYMLVYGETVDEYKQTQSFEVVPTIALSLDVNLQKNESGSWEVNG